MICLSSKSTIFFQKRKQKKNQLVATPEQNVDPGEVFQQTGIVEGVELGVRIQPIEGKIVLL